MLKKFSIFSTITILIIFGLFLSVFLKVDYTPIIEGYVIDTDENQPVPHTVVRCQWLGKVLETTTILKEVYIATDNHGYYRIPEASIRCSFKRGSLWSVALDYVHPFYMYKTIVIGRLSEKIKIEDFLKKKECSIDINTRKLYEEYNEINEKNCKDFSREIHTRNIDYFYWAKKAGLNISEDDIWRKWEDILYRICPNEKYKYQIEKLKGRRTAFERFHNKNDI